MRIIVVFAIAFLAHASVAYAQISEEQQAQIDSYVRESNVLAAQYDAAPRPDPYAVMRAQSAEGSRAQAALRELPAPPDPEVAAPPAIFAPTGEPVTFRDCPQCPDMVTIPAGSFTMGSPANEANRGSDEGPQRRVALMRGFAVGRTEVTRGQFAAFASATGRAAGNNCYTDRALRGQWAQDPRGTWRDPGFSQADDHPVVCVSWEDAQAYVAWLNTQAPRGGYRLLTEAEWEYAARAGTTSPYIWGADPNAGCAHANGADATARASYAGWTTSTCNDGALNTAVVAAYQRNVFGLYDMIGNVWEWVQDCYAESYSGLPTDGSASEISCSYRGNRGGSWVSNPRSLRSAIRYENAPSVRGSDLGFRVARTLN
jgi:formylglycine-generating enzyme required for sulfatase activity